MKSKKILIILVLLMAISGTAGIASADIFDDVYTRTGTPPLSVAGTPPLPIAGWRASASGLSYGSNPVSGNYLSSVAIDISKKFPGTTPGGVLLVGETHGTSMGSGTDLNMPCTSTSKIFCDGTNPAEPLLTTFDKYGVKVILQVEPFGADVNTLIDIVMNQYKNHPSVVGFGVDNEWLPSNANAATINGWNTKLHSINPNYILMIKHYEANALPTGIAQDILVVCDDEQNGNLATLVAEHVEIANRFPSNPYGAQIGYPSDSNIWSGYSDKVGQLGTAVKNGVGSSRPISIIWVDFSLTTPYPESTWDKALGSTPTSTSTTPTPTLGCHRCTG